MSTVPDWVALLSDRVASEMRRLEEDAAKFEEQRKAAIAIKAEEAQKGDLSENAEFQSAVQTIETCNSELKRIDVTLSVYKDMANGRGGSAMIDIGTSVRLLCSDTTKVNCRLMPKHGGSSVFLVDPNNVVTCLIPIDCPVGKALYGIPRDTKEITAKCAEKYIKYEILEVY